MSVTRHFETMPDEPALILVETGETMTFGELEMASRRLGWKFAEWGLAPGDRIALFMDNRPDFFVVVLAALRMGLRIVTINRFLKEDEAAYIVENCDARALFACDGLAEVSAALRHRDLPQVEHFLASGEVPGYDRLDRVLADAPDGPTPDRPAGTMMFYTSGTTGQPKGALYPLDGHPYREGLGALYDWLDPLMGVGPRDRFFISAPIYHSGPCFAAIGAQALGATVVLMKKFDAAASLAAIEAHRVTHAYLVPTMLLRMLKLPEEERQRYDLSSLVAVLHTAEPCPVEVKRRIIAWWGPKLIEIYGASESPQGTEITSEEWLRKPGSVGRAVGCTIHILDEEGRELPPGEPGTIYFEAPGSEPMAYHKDPDKTAEMHNEHGWATVGDIGYLDEDGYLFLTDRKHHMVISGGGNIYPRESEIALQIHPDVLDAVCFGLPDPEMGEKLVAVVVARPGLAADTSLAERLIAHCRDSIAHYKCPKELHFEEDLPRLPTGKIYKHVIRQKYLDAMAGAAEA